jgi:uncharacterized damage-inducible protein DinB
MLGGPDELISMLCDTPVILRALVRGIGHHAASPAGDEGWSVVEVVGHLCGAERRAIARIAQLTTEDRPLLEGYDQIAMVERRRYREQPLDQLLERFMALRAERIAALEGLEPADWERIGLWEGTEAITLTQITTHMCRHDMTHLTQIARLVEQAGIR